MNTQDFDVIVIGSGMGGLALGSILAQMRKKRVLILERHYRLGGFTHAFDRPGGRSWDVGLHYVGDMHPGSMSRSLFDFVTAGGVDWARMPSPFEKFVYPDFTFDVPDDSRECRQRLVDRFPDERAAIEQYFNDVKAASRWFSMHLMAKSAPSVVALPVRLFKKASDSLALGTTREYMEHRFRDPRLRAVLLSQWGDYGLPPSQSAFVIHALIVSHYWRGGYYPVGGAETIAQAIQPIIETRGGACLVNHPVTEILLEGNKAVGVKVRVKHGKEVSEREFRAPIVVSNAGAAVTYRDLLPESVSALFRAELDRLASGVGCVTLYIGFKENPSALGFRGENHWIFNDYDHDAVYAARNELLNGRPAFCYLSFPSLKNPHAKTHTAEIIAPVDYEPFQSWREQPWHKRDAAYLDLKARIGDSMLDFVERHYPGFRNLVDYTELSTPLSVEHFTGHVRGTIYGLTAVPDRFRASWLGTDTPVRNLFLTGADVTTPGIVGALMGGVVTAARLTGGALAWMRIMEAAKAAGKGPSNS
ncbi:MAG: NAD(P)/FAD-dependent oxidoreductase [Candidatus Hydrogenedentes bacterium]|nr:NAD(P)/FAD-dependent oxidoreductase [Candidatus Hydrogenedentota bacterium]